MGRKKVSSDRFDAIEQVTSQFKGFRPASEVLTAVRSVPTIFPQFDVSTRVGGFPLQRVALVHGPSSHGKTSFVLGLIRSFLKRDHYGGLVDAEYTTAADWVAKLLRDVVNHPGFVAARPESYEQTRAAVRNMVDTIKAAVESKALHADTGALIGIDSIGKLIPAGLANKVEKGDKGIDGMNGRAGQIMAGLHGAWLNELVPLLYHCNASMAIITRESENVEAQAFDRKWKVRGGKALFYDASMVLRIRRAEWVKHSKLGIIGEKHEVAIHKTKIGGKDDKVALSYFHTSNGKFVAEGFDRARDAVGLAIKAKVVIKKGAWLTNTLTGEQWNGENEAVTSLTESPELLAELETVAREQATPDIREADEIFQGAGSGS